MKVKPIKILPLCEFCGAAGKETVLIHSDSNINDIGDICITKWCSVCGMAEIRYYRNWAAQRKSHIEKLLLPS